MKQNDLQKSIKRVRNELTWPVSEKDNEQPVVRILSNPKIKSHVILIPDPEKNEGTDLDFLHELGHATLCEKIHPVFSGNSYFSAPEDNKRLFLMVIPALNVATDWFIGDWLIGIAPEQMRAHLQATLKSAEEILQHEKLPPVDIILDASLVIAQAIHYLKEPIDCGGVLQTAVDAFLSTPPDKPSYEACCTLVNTLMSTYTEQRARQIFDGEFDVWEVYRPENGAA
jgi:hypothetical protein